MGNCLGNSASSGAVVTGGKHHNANVKHTTEHTSIHQGFLRDRKMDVYEKYAEIEVLGQGSMGHVARVRARDGTEGGSAYHAKKDHHRGKGSSSLSERRKEKVEYALKSIKLDRVSPIYMKELQNEIDILKGMVSVEVYFMVARCVETNDYKKHVTHNKESTPNVLSSCAHYRTIHISSRPLKYTPIIIEFTSYWNCVMVVICTRDYPIPKREQHRFRAN